MPVRQYLLPRPGVSMRAEDGKTRIPPEGRFVLRSGYYIRRVTDGDAVLGDDEARARSHAKGLGWALPDAPAPAPAAAPAVARADSGKGKRATAAAE